MAYANYSPRVSTGILTASRSGQCPNRRPACPMARPTTLHGAGTAHTSRSSSAWTAVPPTIPMPGTMVVSRLRRPGTRVMRSCSERLRQSRLGHRQTRNTGKLRSLRECSQLVASYRGGTGINRHRMTPDGVSMSPSYCNRKRAKVRIRKLFLAIGGATSLVLAVSGTAAQASPQVHPDFAAEASSSPVPAPYPGAGAVAPAPPTGSTGTAPEAACTPYVDGDDTHVTSGDVSGHGWWYQGTCPNVKTTVKIGLQEYFSNGVWYNKGSVGSKNVYPGGGSANRANARDTCVGTSLAGWRSYVIVTIGTGASAYVGFQNLHCSVPYGSP